MIKFFRKIRQSLIAQNKVSKYLLYAIGEIVLVVVGILIALNINNANEREINDVKITNILKEVQEDLLIDIDRANDVFRLFRRADTVQDLILNNKYTYNDYKSKKAQLYLGFSSAAYEINSIGYDNLMRNIDNVPEKYQSIIKNLKDLYVWNRNHLEVLNERIRENVYKNKDNIWIYDWKLEYLKGIVTDEAINYYLTNSEYKRMVASHMEDRRNIFGRTIDHRTKAIEVYNKINELIENVDSVQKIETLESKGKIFLDDIVGNYRIKDSLVYFPLAKKNIKITFEGGKLYFANQNRQRELIYYNESNFVVKGLGVYVQFNKPKEGELFISKNINGNATYTRVD
jgi:hypothetical protein